MASNSAVYQSLEGTKDTIRLLRASRSSPEDITWSLEHYKLRSYPRRPYTALSYSWGDTSMSLNHIVINSQPFQVIFSVYAILEAIRINPSFSSEFSPLADSWWWIDGICINRADTSERTSQVQLMGMIYQEAYRAVGWLGRGSSGSGDEGEGYTARAEKAILDLNKLCEFGEDVFKGPEGLLALEKARKLVDWPAVSAIFQRPWWSRVWTLQEFLVPPKFEFWCGKAHITRERMNTAIEVSENSSIKAMGLGEWRRVKNRQRLIDWYAAEGAVLPLISLVAYTSDCKATDPKDRIYSVLALAKRKVDEDLVEPSYDENWTVRQAYTDLVVEYVSKHRSLDIICYTHVFHQRSTENGVVALPTWVPDWSADIMSYVLPVMASQTANIHTGNFRPYTNKSGADQQVKRSVPYLASGTRSVECMFSPDRTILICKGIIVDTIANNHRGLVGERTSSVAEASSILETLSRTLALGRFDRYLGYPYGYGDAYHDFRASCLAALENTPVKEHFREWFNIHRSLHIHGTSLETLVRLSSDDPEFARRRKKNAVDLTGNNPWLCRIGDVIESMGMNRETIGLESGRVGMGPKGSKFGDNICVLLGCSIPVVLRRVNTADNFGDPQYTMIGEFYLDDLMKGKAVSEIVSGDFAMFSLV